jgi:hypothetical protein
MCSVWEYNPGVFLRAYLHFLCDDGGIITFNVSNETFGLLPPPPNPENSISKQKALKDLFIMFYSRKSMPV